MRAFVKNNHTVRVVCPTEGAEGEETHVIPSADGSAVLRVKTESLIKDVLQDFYKFTRGAILTGYNILNFDNVFLRGQGKANRYNFDNECEDVFHYAQNKSIHHTFGRETNFHVLTISRLVFINLIIYKITSIKV